MSLPGAGLCETQEYPGETAAVVTEERTKLHLPKSLPAASPGHDDPLSYRVRVRNTPMVIALNGTWIYGQDAVGLDPR